MLVGLDQGRFLVKRDVGDWCRRSRGGPDISMVRDSSLAQISPGASPRDGAQLFVAWLTKHEPNEVSHRSVMQT